MSHAERTGLIVSVALKHGTTPEMLLGRSTRRVDVQARRECAHVLRAVGLSYPEIGLVLHRDHSSIMSLVAIRLDRDPPKYLNLREGNA